MSHHRKKKTTPLQKIVRHKQQERDGSSDEDDIPTMELRRRLRGRETKQKELSSDEDTEIDIPANDRNTPKVESETPSCSRDYSDLRPLEKMEIDSIVNKTGSLEANQASEIQTETQTDPKLLMKNLLAAIHAVM